MRSPVTWRVFRRYAIKGLRGAGSRPPAAQDLPFPPVSGLGVRVPVVVGDVVGVDGRS